MAELCIPLLSSWSLQSAFPPHCEGAGAFLTSAWITQGVAQNPEDGPPGKIHLVIIENQAEHLV